MSVVSEKVTFRGSSGQELAARLDRPVRRARAFAVFAHCFTCSKDIFAASRIAQGLAAQGLAVLRFDFTGIGASAGEFANTDFSSNVADIVAAADWLRGAERAPELLVGHSLGGAAVLAAAGEVPEARAVATIGAPADAEHVTRNFAADLSRIEAEGLAEVSLGGRRFTIRREFLEDLREQRLEERVAGLKRALLLFHAPRDMVVGIENAGRIFAAAKHPKSFISLDGADHLLSDRADAAYVADVLAAWVARYVSPPPEEQRSNLVRVRETGAGAFQQLVEVGGHTLLADEPVEQGGAETGPSPYDYLAIALGTCTSMTLRMYADRKGIPLGKVTVTVDHDKVHAADCRDCGEGREGRIDRFERVLEIEGGVAPELREKLVEIAGKCPVHRTLEKSSAVVTRVAEPDAGPA